VQASTQLQAALLFVIGFSTFFGELLEPVYKFGRDNRELFEVMTSSIAWALSYLPGDVDIDQRIRATYDVLNRECLPTRAALETTNAVLGDLEKYLAADKTANDEKCQAFFKVIGYVYGLAGSHIHPQHLLLALEHLARPALPLRSEMMGWERYLR
jgi:hypothetical protein